MNKVNVKGGYAACKRDGFHIWSYDEKGRPASRVDSHSESIEEMTLAVDCVRCGATIECVGEWENPEEITLAGFGDFSEDPQGLRDLKKAAKQYGLEFYPTYYDHELKGAAEDIEKLTLDLWSMSRDEWSENALTEGSA